MKNFYTKEEVCKILGAVTQDLLRDMDKPWFVQEATFDEYSFNVAIKHREKIKWHNGYAYYDDLFPSTVYHGRLTLGGRWPEEHEGILLLDDEPLAQRVRWDRERYGKYLSVSYYISDERMESEEKLQNSFLRALDGDSDVQYAVCYSEITGYLYTTEELKVGGHDLIRELTSYVGKYLYLKVHYSSIAA